MSGVVEESKDFVAWPHERTKKEQSQAAVFFEITAGKHFLANLNLRFAGPSNIGKAKAAWLDEVEAASEEEAIAKGAARFSQDPKRLVAV